MREMTPDEVKKVQLEILDVVAEFCDRNNIKYWLDSGTLLGAVRHKGYIPWDDDIDLGMLRPDYDRFLREFNLSNDRYRFVCGENSRDFHSAYGKVLDTTTVLYEPDMSGYKLAVNIDVFVYDNAPDDDRLVKKMFDKRDQYRRLSDYRNLGRINEFDSLSKKIAKRALFSILRLFPKDYFVKKMVSNTKKYKDTATKRIGNFTAYSRTICDIHAFDQTVPMEFERKSYKVPAGWDKWLTAMFGNYMELPPMEKRITHHSYVALVEN